MDLISQVVLLGGVCDRRTIVTLRSAKEVDAALRAGVLVADSRGRYALPLALAGVRTANRVVGVLSHRSAAQHHGWAQKTPDGLPEITFPRTRRVDRGLRKLLVPHWSDLPDDDVHRSVTTVRRTLVDCARNLPWDEAVAIADSALRAGDVTKDELLAIALSTRGRGRRRIISVARAATSKAANVFESVLRAQALLIPGLSVVAQEPIRLTRGRARPDLVDVELRIVIEAESFEWHGQSSRLSRDCRRYNELALMGWQVIRFSWYQVMFQPEYVQAVLRRAVEVARAMQAWRPPEHANVA